jgi:hypothetical protein
MKPELKEKDAMICRACGREERASEGYPCEVCGTFICLPCTNRGVVRCSKCVGKAEGKDE